MEERKFLSFLKDESLRQYNEESARQAHEIAALTQGWTDMPKALKTFQEVIFERGRTLYMKDKQQRQRSQELQTKLAAIQEIESLQIQIAGHKRRKETLTVEASDLKKKGKDSRRLLHTLEEQNAKARQDLVSLRNQVEEKKKIELGSTKDRLVSTTRKLNMKKDRLDGAANQVTLIEDKLYKKEEELREVKQSYEDEKLERDRIKRDLDNYTNRQERLQRKINDDAIALDQAAQSIQSIANKF